MAVLRVLKGSGASSPALLYDYNFAYIDPYEEQLRGQAGIKILWKLEVSLSL